MSKIKSALENIFKENRIVFWYDEREELNFEFNELDIEEVNKVTVDNNEFSIKHRIIKADPDKKFLLYITKEKPSDSENWLLDLNLAAYEFHTDRSSIFLQELNMPQEFRSLVQQHLEFFKNSRRLERLKDIYEKEDTERKVRLKLISVICNSNPNIKSILFSLFADLVKDNDEKSALIEKCNLSVYFWQEIERVFGYTSEQPSLLDFGIEIFKSNFNYYTNKKYSLTQDAIVFLSSWIDSAKYQSSYIELANKLEAELKIHEQLENIDYRELLKVNVFRVVEQKILSGLKSDLISDTIKYSDAKEIINTRSDRFWYSHYLHLYNALSYAIEFIHLIKRVKFEFKSLDDGFKLYKDELHKIDYFYRKFLYEFQLAGNTSLLKDLSELIEKHYSNNFLLPLNDKWQSVIDSGSEWNIPAIIPQRRFFDQYVKPFIEKEQKLFVIISDALRYEIGQELLSRILSENRFEASISEMYTSLPSYTKLGMASLLPHTNLSFKTESDEILCDEQSTQGLESRNKVLQKHVMDAAAIKSDNFLNMPSKTEGREFVKAHSLVYVYSNIIDKTGDDPDSEVKVIKDIEDEIENIIRILKHVANCNGNNAIITADHGFIYQNHKIDDSDFSEYEKFGKIFKANRRFIIGMDLKEEAVVKKFKPSDLNIQGDCEILIPKSINRLRVKRSGSRYVHGGSSLQEIVIPVIQFSKKRIGSIEFVEVDVIRNFNKITSNQIVVTFYQIDKVEEKVKPRELRTGFYSADGQLLSDQPNLSFNSNADEATMREKKHRFSFSQNISQYNNQTVYLILEEKIPNTNQYVEYKKVSYTLQISFTSDFDDF